MNLLAWVDFYCVLVVQYFSHRVESLTGWDCFMQRRPCLAFAGACFLLGLLEKPSPWLWLTLLGTTTSVLGCAFMVYWATQSDPFSESLREITQSGYINPLKVSGSHTVTRLFSLLWVLIMLPMCVYTGHRRFFFIMFCLWGATNLLACNPLPPGSTKLKDRLKAWLTTPFRRLQPAGSH